MSEETTNPVVEEELVSTPAEGVVDEAHAQGDDHEHDGTEGDLDNPEGEGDGEPADDHEEIEHDGVKARVPKALKEAFLRQQDYTRKTQEVAETRRSIEAEREALAQQRAQQAEAVKTLRADIGKVERLQEEIKAFDGVDWAQAQREITAQPPERQVALWAQYNAAWHKFEATRNELTQAQTQLSEKEKALASEQTQRVQAAQRETFATLERDIPGFNADVLRSVVDHGMKAYGLRPDEAQQIADPRVWKLLHADQVKAAELNKLKAENAKLRGQRTAQSNNEAATKVTPAVPVKGKAPATGAPRDDMPIDEWMRRENERVARKGRR